MGRRPPHTAWGWIVKGLLLLAAMVAVVSCSETSGPTNLGTITFTFTGAGGGTFTASGPSIPLEGSAPTTSSWTVGVVDEAQGQTVVVASVPAASGLVDFVAISLDRATTGAEPLDAACNIDGDVCTGMVFFRNFNPDGDAMDIGCGLTTGSVVIAEITSSRLKGTFSGSGECVEFDGFTTTPFTVTNGSFDVARVAPPS